MQDQKAQVINKAFYATMRATGGRFIMSAWSAARAHVHRESKRILRVRGGGHPNPNPSANPNRAQTMIGEECARRGRVDLGRSAASELAHAAVKALSLCVCKLQGRR